MNRGPQLVSFCLLLVLGCTPAATFAKKPGGGGGGGVTYTIVDLPGPYHQEDGGWSQTYTTRISDVGDNGVLFVLGERETGTGSEPCSWMIEASGPIATDLAELIDWGTDINSAGVVSGRVDLRPVLLFPDGMAVFPEDVLSEGPIRALNNPDTDGIFQAVGTVTNETGYVPYLWDVSLDGTMLASTILTDASGQAFYPYDVSDAETMSGTIVVDGQAVPATAAFDRKHRPLGL